jgi:hypothetical protein
VIPASTKINQIKSVANPIALPVLPLTKKKRPVPNASLASTKIKQMENNNVKNVQRGNGAVKLLAGLNAPITVLKANGRTKRVCLPIRNVKIAVQESGALPRASRRTSNVQRSAVQEGGVLERVPRLFAQINVRQEDGRMKSD